MQVHTYIPNTLTFISLSIGIISLILIDLSQTTTAMLLIIIASLLDALDGNLARKLKITSKLGEELDSLTDVITFIFVPSFLFYKIYSHNHLLLTAALAIICCLTGAYRLARYNTQKTTHYFEGLPTTYVGLLICYQGLFFNSLPFPLVATSLGIISLLMISHIPYPKFTYLMRKHAFITAILTTILSLLSNLQTGIFVIMLIYLFSGIFKLYILPKLSLHQPIFRLRLHKVAPWKPESTTLPENQSE